MNFFRKKILVFSRIYDQNCGDPIIGDCCKYIIEKTAKQMHCRVNVSVANMRSKNMDKLKPKLVGQKAIVFPGGGLNSAKFNQNLLRIFNEIERHPKASVFFNAIGILRVNPRPQNEALLKEIFNKPQVKQITTRGDYKQLQKYITTPKPFPSQLVFDPAIWVNEAYGIEKNPNADTIGVGVIRPEIFERNGNKFVRQKVIDMYIGIIHELEARGYKWKLFINGTDSDYAFGLELLEYLQLPKETYFSDKISSPQELVTNISNFKAIIAARLHANIIATSLDVPSVGLVWNDKMNLFADIIGCKDRYINTMPQLLDASYVVDQLESAIANGYDHERIDAMKDKTIETIKNIIKS